MDRVPDGLNEQLAACRWLRYRYSLLGRTTVDELRESARRFFNAGYTAGDIVHALSNEPLGQPWTGGTPAVSDAPEKVLRWVRMRLQTWLDDEGDPFESRSMQLERIQVDKIMRHKALMAEFDEERAKAHRPEATIRLARMIAARGHGRGMQMRRQAEQRELQERQQRIEEERAHRRAIVEAFRLAMGDE